MTIAALGVRSSFVKPASRSGSVVIAAGPLMRRVSFLPGTIINTPARPCVTMLR